jgi:Trk K+ transport system NAD-binding subunit
VLEVLRQARAGTARAIVACTSNDLANLEIALLSRELNPKQRLVLRMSDPQLAETARATANLRLALSLPALAAPAYVAALYGDRVMTLFRLGLQMLAAAELTVQPDDPSLKDQTIRALSIDYQIAPVVLQSGSGAVKLEPGTRLNPGDRLTVIGELVRLERLFRREPAEAEFQIILTHIPSIVRPQAALWLGIENKLSGAEAESAIDVLPIRLGGPKTRGQAAEWMAQLERECIEAKVIPNPS